MNYPVEKLANEIMSLKPTDTLQTQNITQEWSVMISLVSLIV